MPQLTLSALAEQLYKHRADAKNVEHEYFDLAVQADCHTNVKKWIALHPSHRPVCGWLIGDHTDWFRFYAHSVVERDDGSLIDITPSDPPMLFLRHLDRDEHFLNIVEQTPYLTFPPEAVDAVPDFTDWDSQPG